MRAVVIHAPKDLRVETVAAAEPGPRQVSVRVEAGGICGSDLHYYHHGGFGSVRIREPMVLGHEAAGVVDAVGSEVERVRPGDRVAISPSLPCGRCRYCMQGKQVYCLDMRFLGSAMRFPHVQGAFRQELIAEESQCHPVAGHVTAGEAAMAEPLSVCLHAARRAGPLLGRRVLVTGSGPIGVLCAMVARRAGAAEIVVTDIADEPLAAARAAGADLAVNSAKDAEALAPYKRERGSFDVMFEASGNEKALVGALELLQPGAVVVQVGLGDAFTLPISTFVTKELELRGTFRFHEEFALAVDLISRRLLDVKPLLTATLPFEQALEAFALASDRRRAMKVQLAFA
jgi:L-idonate 5-dehydrogenase